MEDTLPDCKVDEEERPKRAKQMKKFIEKAAKIPKDERDFMLALINRAIKLNNRRDGEVSVHVDDVKSALSIGHARIKQLGASLDRLGVGDVDDVGTSHEPEWHARVFNPSDYLTWFDIDNFCDKTCRSLDEFVIHLKFGLLGS